MEPDKILQLLEAVDKLADIAIANKGNVEDLQIEMGTLKMRNEDLRAEIKELKANLALMNFQLQEVVEAISSVCPSNQLLNDLKKEIHDNSK